MNPHIPQKNRKTFLPQGLSMWLISLASLFIILAGIKIAASIVIPFLLALFIAIICSPLVNFMVCYRIPRWLAIAMLVLLILGVFSMLGALVGASYTEFVASIPEYKIKLIQRMKDLNTLVAQFNISLTIPTKQLMEYIDPSIIVQLTKSTLSSLSSALSNLFVIMLIVIFMLLEAPSMYQKLAKFYKDAPNTSDHGAKNLAHIQQVFDHVIRYLVVKTYVGGLTGLAVWLTLSLLGVQYAILWSTVAFLLNYIPNIGSIIATVPIIVQVLILNDLSTLVIVAIALILINMLIGNVIEPRALGKTLGLSTLVVFLSLLFWGWILGTIGMLLSVPLTIAIKVALEANPQTQRYAYLLSDLPKTIIIEEEA